MQISATTKNSQFILARAKKERGHPILLRGLSAIAGFRQSCLVGVRSQRTCKHFQRGHWQSARNVQEEEEITLLLLFFHSPVSHQGLPLAKSIGSGTLSYKQKRQIVRNGSYETVFLFSFSVWIVCDEMALLLVLFFIQLVFIEV